MKFKTKILVIFIFASFFAKGIYAQNMQLDNQFRLAKSFEANGDFEEAEKIYTDLHNNQPLYFQYYQSLYNNLVGQKKYQQSLELSQNQIKISRNVVSLYGDLGSAYFALGNEKEAIKIWNEAVDIEPENPFAYRTIANYLIDNRLIEEAIDVLQKGNEVSKDDKTIFSYDIANLYSITMKFEEAGNEYCKILAQKPTQINLVNNRIAQYINSNQAAEPTLKAISNAYEETDNVVFLRLLVDMYSKTNNNEDAFKTTVELENKSTNNGSAIFDFARRVGFLGDFSTSAEAYKYFLDNYKSSAIYSEAEIGYARSLEAELNKRENTSESWKPFIKNNSKSNNEFHNLIKTYKSLASKYSDNKVGWEAEFRIGIIYLENLQEYQKADSIFKKIVDQGKSIQFIDDANYFLSEISVKSGNLDDAQNYLEKVLNSARANNELKNNANYLFAKTEMWKGEFTKAVEFFKKVIENPKDENVNDALQYNLILNTLKNDSTNLFLFINADYLVERNNFNQAITEFKKLAENKNLFLLKNFSALRYVELQIALNNYDEAVIFLEEMLNCDEDNIYKDRFLFLLGSNYYYGLKNEQKALEPLTKLFEVFPNSIYSNKARKVISEINEGVNHNL